MQTILAWLIRHSAHNWHVLYWDFLNDSITMVDVSSSVDV